MGYRSGVAMSYAVGGRRSSDPVLLWLWCRPAAAVPIQPLAWQPPYAMDTALKRPKKKKKKIKTKFSQLRHNSHFDWMILCCGLVCVLEDVVQPPWSLPTRVAFPPHPQPAMTNKNVSRLCLIFPGAKSPPPTPVKN